MTQSSLQTRCPKCDTRFRVTDEQLSIAKGKVRCGNCMEVFNAIDHQVAPPGPAKPAAPEPTRFVEAGEAASGFSADDDFVFADNPEEDAAEGKYAGTNLTFSDEELSDSFRSFDEKSPAGGHEDDDRPNKELDESWAEAMLSDDDSEKDTSRPATPRTSTAAPAPDTQESDTAPEPRPAIAPSVTPAARPQPAEPATPPAKTSADTRQEPPLSLEPTGEQTTAPTFTEAPAAPPEPEPDEPLSARFPYHDLRREPVSVGGGSGGTVRRILWTLAVLALAGLLVAQVTWFQFDRLSAIPELRPFYEQGCELAGCELKPLLDVDAIQSRKLVVRTDPENRSQLLVEAVIINRAAFEQPFPAIALTFSNLNGDVVAQSVFTPDEYIAGDGRDLAAMPTETPVRIAIGIRDPGRDAVNYNIAFRAHSQ
ncbi:MAG: DUF3426 domain-containing protein [Marinobacter sp.]|uniref:DUF3426 domain-containing protein n=1 Tax=Marinobacter sp. TaxID=50741 RepID=UPI001B1D0A3D|nr:zinc-ribbon domain-containing protein [Marinobacter sp.]